MVRALVTGANGWVGSALCRTLIARGHQVLGVTRQRASLPDGVIEVHCPGDDFTGLSAAWPATERVDVAFHLAARVHVMDERGATLEPAYLVSNCEATLRVARLAIERGTRRFVFLSSIKALGERDHGVALHETSPAHPEDPYGVSKYRAEQALRELQGIDVVLVRAPLVYGPAVRANFRRLFDLIEAGWPLPLGCAKARRSLVALDNLTDALERCAIDERAAGGIFHVADREAPPVRELLERIGRALGRPAHLFPVPLGVLRFGAALLGRGAELSRLTTPLRVDTSHIASVLDWHAPHTLDESLARAAAWYRSHS